MLQVSYNTLLLKCQLIQDGTLSDFKILVKEIISVF